jgi:DNA-directed RNA polymerase subunit M/transcription elongation factor TFIIS
VDESLWIFHVYIIYFNHSEQQNSVTSIDGVSTSASVALITNLESNTNLRMVSVFIPPRRFDFICPICGREPKYFVTRRSNRNGNAKRPYYKCIPCNKFVSFDDDRGILTQNPPCDCSVQSRMQVAGKFAATARGLHFVCAKGKCGFYEGALAPTGEQYQLDDNLIDMFASLGII